MQEERMSMATFLIESQVRPNEVARQESKSDGITEAKIYSFSENSSGS